MKRFIIILLAAVCTVISCDKFKAKDYTEQEKRIEDAQNAALKLIDEASSSAIAAAEQAITTATVKAVEGAGEDISAAINDAKKEIQSAVETSVSESVETKLKAFENELGKANKFAAIAALIALGAILLAIVLLILLLRRTSHESVVKHVVESRTVESKIEKVVRDYSVTETRPQVKSGISKADVETEVRRYVSSPAFKQYFTGLYSNYERQVKEEPGTQTKDVLSTTDIPTGQSQAPAQVARFELYAKDSPDTRLAGVTSLYQQGKSIYRLVLSSQDSQNAEICICTDKEEVKRRILKSSNDLLEPICKVERRKNNPDDLTTISVKPGKAEKLSGDTWTITEPIIVELS